MQQQQQQHGGTQYGASPSDTAPFASPGAGPRAHMLGIPSGPDRHHHQHQPAEAASPISSRPPPRPNFEELAPAPAPGSYPDEDALAAGEEVERGGGPGNRWPRQETLALLKIRSEMDAAFRDATLKAPLWDDVSRKLAELGYMRSAKKCKEKFENVHKYYKRTKEGRAGRQDGKSYRFFTELEALHGGGGSITSTTATMANPTTNAAPALTPIPGAGISAVRPQAPPISQPAPSPPPPPTSTPTHVVPVLPTPIVAPLKIPSSATALPAAAAATGISFSSDTFSSSFSDSDDEDAEEGGGGASMEGRKRKRGVGKMMAFFEGLMKQVMERQEAMQQRFLETIEKREQDRMVREEAWKRQETARLNREHELMAQEQATAASRDAAVISFLQKMSGQSLQLPPAVAISAAPPPQPSPPQQQHQPALQQLQHQPAPPPPPQLKQQENHLHRQSTEIVRHQPSSSSTEVVPVPEPYEVVGSVGFEVVSSSRWPKPEVHALIKLRSELDSRYQESGPKGPLWEEISAGMQRLGYSRSTKRCKEKWENINKYFKKVKESNRKRPEDAKTCPYFHQLDALYRQKLHGSSGGAAGGSVFGHQRPHDQETNPNPNPQERSGVLMSMAPPPVTQQHPHPEAETKKGGNGDAGNPVVQIPTSNGGFPPSFFEEGAAGGATMKKPEDIVKELMEGQHQQSAAMDDYEKLEEPESDSIVDDDDDEDEDDDEDGGKMKYKIEFQRPNVGGGEKSASGSFLAMVQ